MNLLFQIQSLIIETDPGKGGSSTISWRQFCFSQENTSFWKTKEPEAEYSGAHFLTECAMGLTWSFPWETHPPLSLPLRAGQKQSGWKEAGLGKSQSSAFCSKWTVSAFSSGRLDSSALCAWHPFQPCLTSSQMTGEKQEGRADPALWNAQAWMWKGGH